MADEPANYVKACDDKKQSFGSSYLPQSIIDGFREISLDRYKERLSFLGLGLITFLSFLIFNPFLAVFILALMTLFFKGSSKLSLLVFTLALTIFYASRSLNMPGDDVPVYIMRYQDDLNNGLAYIVSRFFLQPPDNEILYFSFGWIVGKLFGNRPDAFVFIIYFFQLSLLSMTAYIISKRYAAIFLCIFFFGVGDPNPSILHLWRANLGLFVFMLGILIYFKTNANLGRLLIYLSAGFHLSLFLYIVIFELYNLLHKRSGFFLTIILGALIFYLSSSFFMMALEKIFPAKAMLFFNYAGEGRNFTLEIVLVALLLFNFYFHLPIETRFATFLFLAFFIFDGVYSQSTGYMGRLGQLATPIVAIPVFEILMKQKKILVAFVISVLFLRTILKPGLEMYVSMIPEYKNPFYGIFNILFFS